MSPHGSRARLVALLLAATAVSGCDLVYPWSGGSTPAAPGGVRAKLVSFDRVTLSWATERGVGAYAVSSRVGSGRWIFSRTLPGTTSQFVVDLDPAVPEATDLGFRVRAFIGDMPSEWSTEVVVARGLRPASGLTAKFNVWPISPGEPVQLTWIRGSTVADELVLERRAVRGVVETAPWARVNGPMVGDVSCTDWSVGAWTDGSRLEYRLRYVLGALASESVGAATDPAPPLPPTGLAASSFGGLEIRLTWMPVSQIPSAQQVVQRTRWGYSDWQDVATLGPTAASHDDTVPAGGVYQYRITVRAAGSVEASCPPADVGTPSGPLVPSFVDVPGIPVDRDAEGRFTTVAIAPSGLRVYSPDASGWITHDIPDPAWNFLAPPYLRAGDGTVHVFYGVYFPDAAHDWRDTDGWHSEALPFRPTDAAIDTAGALHLVACENGLDLSYATNRSGTWVSEPLPHSGTAERCAIAVGADGEPQVVYAVLRPYLPGDLYPQVDVRFALHGASGWQEEPAPAASAVVARNLEALRLLGVASGTTLIVDDGTSSTSELDAYDRSPDGWGAAARVATVANRVKIAVSADGTRLAVAWTGVYPEPAVAIREANGAWTTWPLSGSWVNSLGFTPSGKLWVYTGVALYTER